MLLPSPALEFALEFAEYEALTSGSRQISAEHLLVGIFSLDKVLLPEVEQQIEIPPEKFNQFRAEWLQLKSILSMMGAEPKNLRRLLRRRANAGQEHRVLKVELGKLKHLWPRLRERSAGGNGGGHELREAILRAASQLAAERGWSKIGAVHVMHVILRREAPLRGLLAREGVDVESLATLLLADSPQRTYEELLGIPNESTTASENLEHSSLVAEDQSTKVEPRVDEHEHAIPGTQRSAESMSAAPEGGEHLQSPKPELPEQITESIAAEKSTLHFLPSSDGVAERLALLCDLPLRIDKDADLGTLLQHFLEAAIQIVPGATQGAVCLGKELRLKAHLPIEEEPLVSTRAAWRAFERQEGFICRAGEFETLASRQQIYSMYAPLLWKGESLGIICVYGEKSKHFDSDDLKLFLGLAQHASMAVANLRMQEELKRKAATLERLLKNFSPKIREELVRRAQHGRLHLGGQRSEVTILFSDIRHFTRITREMDTDDVVEMLNECFSACVESLIKFDGTVDKFIGDAILAVFGSPEPDPEQHIKAVRAALEMQAAVAELNQRRKLLGKPPCEIGIGIHCGEVLHGFIGSSERIEFTVIGDPVNFASRYCDNAEAGQILVSRDLYEHNFHEVEAQQVAIRAKHEGTLAAYAIKRLKTASGRKSA
jgi:class 3 adenylate cyclase